MTDPNWKQRAADRRREIAEEARSSDLDSLVEHFFSNWIPVSERLPPFSRCEVEADGMRETGNPVLVRLADAKQIAEFGRYRVATYYRSSSNLDSYDVFEDPDAFIFEDNYAWRDGWEDAVEDVYYCNLTPDAWLPLPVHIREDPRESGTATDPAEYDPEDDNRLIQRLIEDHSLLRVPSGRRRGSKRRTIESEGAVISVDVSSTELPRKDDIEWLRDLAGKYRSMVPEGMLLEQELARGGTRESLRERVQRCCVLVAINFEGKGRAVIQSTDTIFEAWRIRNPRDPDDIHSWSTADIVWSDSAPWDDDPGLAGIWFNRPLLDHFLQQQSV